MRVCLARAVYSRASTVLLDDVTSAVDSETRDHIVQHCFKSPLMADRTVIVASHAVDVMAPLADLAIFLQNGTVAWHGAGRDLLNTSYMKHLQTPQVLEQDAKHKTDVQPKNVDVNAAITEPDRNHKPYTLLTKHDKTPRQQLLQENREKATVSFGKWLELKGDMGGNWWWLTLMLLVSTCAGVTYISRRILE